MRNEPKKVKLTNCVKCDDEFGTINSRGKVVRRLAENLCGTCYQAKKRSNDKSCSECGSVMRSSSISGYCRACKVKPKKIKGSELNRDILERIRRVLVRYKSGNNSLVDNLIVVDIYLEINSECNSVALDSLTEESQVVEMLKRLKGIYDFYKEREFNF